MIVYLNDICRIAGNIACTFIQVLASTFIQWVYHILQLYFERTSRLTIFAVLGCEFDRDDNNCAFCHSHSQIVLFLECKI